MNEKKNRVGFFAEEIKLEYIGKEINKEQIDEVIDDFPGKDDFIDFYLTHNGGSFMYGAWFNPDDYYNIPQSYQCLTLMSFIPIPIDNDSEDEPFRGLDTEYEKDLIVEKFSNFEDFVLFHIPFALDAAGSPFWIDIQSGEIKFTDFQERFSADPDDAITVAFSFGEFCKRITNRNI